MSQTNDTTNSILKFLFEKRIFAWRQNTAGIPLPQGGFRPSGKTGLPDIFAIVPPEGKFLGIEVKTTKDRLRPAQEGFIANAAKMGATVLVVKSYEDFLSQFDKYISTS